MNGMMKKKAAILFVHGIVGNSRCFDFLRPSVPEGWSVTALTLEGHEGNAADFSGASMAQWKRQVTEAVEKLSRECGTVIVAAHSMGTLFALSEGVSGRVAGLFLLNPPMRIRITWRLLMTPVKVMLGLASDAVTAAARDAYGISLDRNPLHYCGWPRRYMELFAEIRRTRGIIGEVKCPSRVFIAREDEMVAPSSEKFFDGLPGCEVTLLPESGHYYSLKQITEQTRP